MLPWALPSQGLRLEPRTGVTRAPPARFAHQSCDRSRRRLGVSISSNLAPSETGEPAPGRGNPHRVLAPDHTHVVRAKRRPGCLFHLAPRRALLPTADALMDGRTTLP